MEALPVRQSAMWPDKPLDFVKLAGDETALHWGVICEGQLVSVVSVFIGKDEAQFRKFATLKAYQGRGFGTFLLNYTIEELRIKGIKTIWCNARILKHSFYERFGLSRVGEEFVKNGMSYVKMEKSLI